jgi:hypothetical protein
MFRKLARAIGLAADLAPGALLVSAGLALVVGGSTGVLW